MALVDGIDVPPETIENFQRALTVRPGFFGNKVDKKTIVYRVRNFVSLIARSPFQSIAYLWNNLTSTEQTNWDDAASWAGLSGWDLFVMDTQYRRTIDLPGLATPNLFHQFFVGRIKIEAPANRVILRQSFSNIPATDFSFIVNWFQQLTAIGPGAYCRLRYFCKTGYWNDDTDAPDVAEDVYDLYSDTVWNYDGLGYSGLISGNNHIDLFIEVYNMTGLLYIDGVEFNYNDQNFINDFQCNYFAINWSPDLLPEGVTYGSYYPPDNI